MAIIKCKMCGGDLNIIENASTAECEFCGSVQTIPKLDNEKKLTLFTRANRLRSACEFDKAFGVYESIVAESEDEAEAYWGLILCKYGIEYVDDPKTAKKIPTCHRSSFESVFDDPNFDMVMECAEPVARALYREEAKAIEQLRTGIIDVSAKEEPYDIFICYKETDMKGQRTIDSVIAQDIYDVLAEKGYKVFFSRITLEDKLGQEYEPYIFAALNSAKIMLAFGTDYEHFNAVWVKNEWSRFLKLMENGEKKTLIPCYKGIDAYDMPKEFARLQAQDMGKVGATQDLLRGIEKILPRHNEKVQEKVAPHSVSTPSTAPLLQRAFMFLEDGAWKSADEYCEKVLDIDPENAEAYLGKLLSELEVRNQESLKDQAESFSDNNNYQKAVRFGDEKLKSTLAEYIDYINSRNERERLESIYNRAKSVMSTASNGDTYKEAAQLFDSVSEYKDSFTLANDCKEKAKTFEEEKPLCDKLFKEYISAVQREDNDRNKKLQVSKQVNDLTKQLQKLMQIKEKWNEIEENIDSHNKEIPIVQATISKLKNERLNLGLLAVKRKKELDDEIRIYEDKICSLKQTISDEESKRGEFESLDLLISEIRQIQDKIDAKKGTIDEISKAMNAHKIREELSKYAYGTILLSRYDKIGKRKVGDYIKFGSYKQRNYIVKTNIEWLVLEVKGSMMLVISKYALDCKRYNITLEDVTWETCSLREWLNSDFIDEAFSAEEKAMIPKTTVSADKNPEHSTNPGNVTMDQIFLLDITETNNYFSSDSTRSCKATKYAVSNGASVRSESDSSCQWWLRSPGENQSSAADISRYGWVSYLGERVTALGVGVRPALWIDLNLYYLRK